MNSLNQELFVKAALAAVLVLNVAFWFSIRDIRSHWNNVPPVPDEKYASAYGLGDKSFAYRLNGIMIQNLGDTGGRVTSLKDYDYGKLAKWFFLQDHLDKKSNFIPYLAGYYFSGVQEPEKFRPVLDYLEQVGNRDYGQKWRWLAQAVFIARYKLNDLDKALSLANVMAKINNDNMPSWARQMPAFIMSAKGEKDAAYALMLEILKTSADKMHPNEVNAMRAYICEQILEMEEAKQDPICEGIF